MSIRSTTLPPLQMPHGTSTWVLKPRPVTVTLSQFCGLHGLTLTVYRRDDDTVKSIGVDRYYASFTSHPFVETVEDPERIRGRTCVVGNGCSTRAALKDIARQLSGAYVMIGETSYGGTPFKAPTIKGL